MTFLHRPHLSNTSCGQHKGRCCAGSQLLPHPQELDEPLWELLCAMTPCMHDLAVSVLAWSSPKTSPTTVTVPQCSQLPAVSRRACLQIDGDGREIKSQRWPGGDPAVLRGQREGPLPGSCVARSHPQGEGQGQCAPLSPHQLLSAMGTAADRRETAALKTPRAQPSDAHGLAGALFGGSRPQLPPPRCWLGPG